MLKKWSLSILIAPFILIFSYLLMVLIGGLLSTEQKRQINESKTIIIYVASNGVHLNLWLPTKSSQVDWQAQYPNSFPYKNMQWTQIGWGSEAFYTQVPTWADLTLGITWQALTGDNSVIQLSGQFNSPIRNENKRKILLSHTQYQELVNDIQKQFSSKTPLFDNFYAAKGSYNAYTTCNEWVRKRLSAIGIKMPLWSPFDKVVLWYLPKT
ncbi:TIGR02117 family protein [Pseudomonas sp. F1_0610]|uniref:TIGR02117 family protein n=1 Tax=Pseudomonas sp. F1_0610 TaxID=3114284 RepID=UPI0039C3DDCD